VCVKINPQSLEVVMNDYTFAKEFVGNLRAESDPVPVRVNTRLHVMTEETAREVREYISGATGTPRYVFNGGGDLPLHPSLHAFGRHYFNR
jgi:hypothetical protein